VSRQNDRFLDVRPVGRQIGAVGNHVEWPPLGFLVDPGDVLADQVDQVSKLRRLALLAKRKRRKKAAASIPAKARANDAARPRR
jgi:hypothetical protein